MAGTYFSGTLIRLLAAASTFAICTVPVQAAGRGDPNEGTRFVRPAPSQGIFFEPAPRRSTPVDVGGTGGTSEGGNSAHDSDSNGRDDGRDADAAGAASGPDSTGPDGGPGL